MAFNSLCTLVRAFNNIREVCIYQYSSSMLYILLV